MFAVLRPEPVRARFALAASLLMAYAPLAGAATFTVNNLADTANPTGVACTAPNPGTCTLRAAIVQANAAPGADTILFDATLNGGTTQLLSNYPPITEALTITGPAGGFTVDGNAFSLLRFTATAGSSSVTNLTLTRGRNATAPGGAIYNAGTLTLASVTVSGNTAVTGFGGGIYTQGILTLTNTTVTGNTAGAGGGIFAFSAAADGLTSTLTITGGSISGNTATGVGGGGLYALADEGNYTLSGVIIENNAASNADGIGGGIFASKPLAGASFTIDDSTIRSNTATDFGGGVYILRGRIAISDTTLSGNSATTAGAAQGGGIYLDVDSGNGASVALSNTTISGNTAWVGGGIGIAAANLAVSSMVHTTVALNTATEPNGGGGVAYGTPVDIGLDSKVVFPGAFGNPFTSNLFASNTGNACRTAFAHTDPDNAGYNHATDTSCGFGQATDVQHADAGLLRALAANGSARQTHALKKGNPAIDHANYIHATTTDARGAPIANGDEAPDPATERDAGAYEFGGYGAIEFTSATFSKDEDTSPAAITIRRFGNTATAPQVAFTTAPGSTNPATAVSDFTDSDQSVAFAATETQKTVNVPIIDDRSDTPEANETVALALASPTLGADLTGSNGDAATLTIVEIEEGKLQFSAATYSFDENVVGNVATITVKRVTGNARRAVSVAYAASNGTGMNAAIAGTDYTAASGTLNWADNDAADKTFTVPLVDNQLAEGSKVFRVTLSAPGGNAILGTPTQADVTITDSDPPQTGSLELEFVSYAVVETAGSPFKVKRVGGSQNAITVQCVPVDGTATLGTDYTNPTQTLTWADGDSADKICDINLTNDVVRESDKAFMVRLQNPANTTVPAAIPALTAGKDQAAVTLTSDERPRYAFDATSYSVLETATSLTVTVQAVDGAPFGRTVTVPVTITSGTATGGVDYTPTTASDLTWTASDSAPRTITFMIVNDGSIEGNEAFTVQLGAPVGGAETVGTNPVTVTIVDPPAVRFKSTTFTGPETNGSALRVTVERVGNPSGTASVEYTVTAGTATENGDYTPPAGTPMRSLSWGNNDTVDKSFDITVIGDALDEADETIALALGNPSSGVLIGTPGGATAVITDDDASPTISIGDVAITEGDTNDVAAAFTVSLSAASGRTVTVNLATANGTGQAPGDYTAQPTTTLTFLAGETAKSVNVAVKADGLDEDVETFTLNLGSPVNATIADATGIATITDATANVAPTVSLAAGQAVLEGTGAGTTTVTVTATLSAASGRSVTVPLSIGASSTASSADYTAPTPRSITIPAGSVSGSYSFTLARDGLDEATESVVFVMGTPINATAAAPTSHTVSITDDDAAPTVSLAVLPATVVENGGAATVTATLSTASAQAVSVTLGFTGTATNATDYTASTTAITIPAGATSGTATVTAVQDSADELDETVIVAITFVTNATASGAQQGTVTILDDDVPPADGGGGGSWSLLSLWLLLPAWLRRRAAIAR